MKLFGYFVLFILVLYSSARYQQDSDDSDEEAKPVLRHSESQNQYIKRLLWEMKDARSYKEKVAQMHLRASAAANSNNSTGGSLLNFTVVQRGLYIATAKINFLRNGLQDEFSTSSMAYGNTEVFMLQNNASDVISHLRIRFSAVGAGDLTDVQVRNPNAVELCYVLTGTVFTPVYALCAPGETYNRK